MADSPELSDLLRRTMEANVRLYRGWLDLSLEYFKGITEILDPQSKTTSAPAAAAASEPKPDPGGLVLEAEEGAIAKAAFVVTNDLGRELTCDLVAAPFTDPDGKTIRPKVTFEPSSVVLAPGQQQVVQASVAVGKSLAPGTAYAGSISVKGMEGFTVPVVVRRLHSLDSPIDRAVEERPVAKAKAQASKGRAKKAVVKKAAKSAAKSAAKKEAAPKAAKKKATVKKAVRKKATAKKAAAPKAAKKVAAKRTTTAKKAAKKVAAKKSTPAARKRSSRAKK